MHCILERREHTVVANTHVEALCVGGVVVLLNDMEKLTLLEKAEATDCDVRSHEYDIDGDLSKSQSTEM